jgi:hypothetical protein
MGSYEVQDEQWSSDADYLAGLTLQRERYKLAFSKRDYDEMYVCLKNQFNDILQDVPNSVQVSTIYKSELYYNNFIKVEKILNKLYEYQEDPKCTKELLLRYIKSSLDILKKITKRPKKRTRMNLMMDVQKIFAWFNKIKLKFSNGYYPPSIQIMIEHKFDVAYRLIINETTLQDKLYKKFPKRLVSQVGEF